MNVKVDDILQFKSRDFSETYNTANGSIQFTISENILKIESRNNGVNSGAPIEEIAIKDALGKIPYEQRICVVLHYVEGFKYREIAETMGISEEAVRKRVTRGVQVFRRLYDRGEK